MHSEWLLVQRGGDCDSPWLKFYCNRRKKGKISYCCAIFNQSPAPKVTDVDLKTEAGSSLGLSLDMRSTRVHSRRLTTVLITDAATRWRKSSVYMSLPLTKGYFFSQRVCTLGRQSDGARASRGNRSRVDFIDVTLLIYTAVKGGGGDLKWGGGEREERAGVKLSV